MAEIHYEDKDLIFISKDEYESCTKGTVGTAVASKKEYKLISDDQAYFPTTYEEAPAWLQTLVQATTDASLEIAQGDLEEATRNILIALEAVDVAKNTYEQSIISSDDIDQRILTAITTLNSSLEAADATILDIAQTATTPEEATALASQVLSASLQGTDVGDIGSTIQSLQAAIISGDETNATSIQALTSTLDGLDTDIEANASAVTTLNTSVGIDSNGSPTGTGILRDLDDLQNQIDGSITTWFRTGEPTLANLPASDWITNELKNNHLGDLYYDNTTGYAYRFAYEDIDDSPDLGVIYTWIKLTDTDVTKALADAAQAQETADGKIVTFYSNRASEPTAEGIGDLWYVTDEDNKIHRWNGTSWAEIADSRIAAHAAAITTLNAFLKDPNTGVVGGAESQLIQTVDTKVADGVLETETKFQYNSLLNIGGVYYRSGFGIDATATNTPGSGTNGDPYISEFWIDAGRFTFTNSNVTGSVKPFVIDATGTTPKVTFTGIVDFASTNSDGTSTFDGDNITTGSIVADKINTAGLIAENISANEIVGKTIEGATINGAKINGAVIKASYLDLDGELEVLTNFYLITDTDTSQIPALAVTENRYILNYVYNINHDSVLIENSNYYRIPSLSTVREANTSVNIVSNPFTGLIHAYNMYQVGSNIKAVNKIPILTVTNSTEVFRYDFTIHPAFNSSYINTTGYSTTSFDISLFGESRTLSWNLASMSGNQSGDDSGGLSQYIQSGQVYLGGVLIFNNVTGSYSRTFEDDPGTTIVGDSTYTTSIKGVTVNVRLIVNVGFSCSLTITIPSGTYQSTSEFSNDALIKFTSNSVSTSATRTSYNAKTSLSMLVNNIV